MDARTLRSFVKEAIALQADDDTPADYVPTVAAIEARFPGLRKTSMDWHKFREGVEDEGIPLGGAAIGAALSKNSLRGAALGYAAGGGASLLRSKLRGEQPSMSRKILAASALGYGAGGAAHGALEHVLGHNPKAAKYFTEATGRGRFVSEALPAAGATLGTGIALGTSKDSNQ